MGTLHGKGGLLYLAGSGVAVKIGECKKWSFNIDKELAPDDAMGDTWKTQLMGLLSWSGSIEGNFDSAQITPFEAATATSTKNIYLYPDSTSLTKYYYGMCWPKLSVDVDKGSVESFTCSFEGDGQLAAN